MAKTIIKDKAVMMEQIRELIAEGKTVTLTVKGNSMNPLMVHLRDQITLGPWKDEDIKAGTVALVKELLAHPELLEMPADTPVEYAIKR